MLKSLNDIKCVCSVAQWMFDIAIKGSDTKSWSRSSTEEEGVFYDRGLFPSPDNEKKLPHKSYLQGHGELSNPPPCVCVCVYK